MGRCNSAILALAITFFVSALLPPSFAITCSWVGMGGDFADPVNWIAGLVPGPEDDVLVPIPTIMTVSSHRKVKSLHLVSTLFISGRLEVTTLTTEYTAQITFTGTAESPASLSIGSNVTFSGAVFASSFGRIEGNGFAFHFTGLPVATWQPIIFSNVIVKMRTNNQLSNSQLYMIENSVFEVPPKVISGSKIYWSDYNSVTLSEWDLRSNSIMWFDQIGDIDISNVVMQEGCGFDFNGSNATVNDLENSKFTYLHASYSNIILRNINLMENIKSGEENPFWNFSNGTKLSIEFSRFEGNGFAIRPTMDTSTTIVFSQTSIIFANETTKLIGIENTNFDRPFLQFSDCNLEWPVDTSSALPLHYTLFSNSNLILNTSTEDALPWIFDGQTNLTGTSSFLRLSSNITIHNNNLILPSIDFTPTEAFTSVVDLGESSLSDLIIRNSFSIGAQSTYFVNAGVTILKSVEGNGAFNISISPTSRTVTVYETIEPQLNVDNIELEIQSGANVSHLYATNCVISLQDGATGVHWISKSVSWRKSGSSGSTILAEPVNIDFYEPNTLENGIQIAAQTVTVEGTLTWELDSWSNSAFISASDRWIALSDSKKDVYPMDFKIIIAGALVDQNTPTSTQIVESSSLQPLDDSMFSFVTKTGPTAPEVALGTCFAIETTGQYVYSATRRNSSCDEFPVPDVPDTPISSVPDTPISFAPDTPPASVPGIPTPSVADTPTSSSSTLIPAAMAIQLLLLLCLL